jgi:uncharacterized membrane protein
MSIITTQWLKTGYRLGLFIKGLDGAIEMAGGLFLIFTPQADLRGILTNWATTELTKDPHDIIATWVTHLDQRLTHGLELFAAVYLLIHGLIKIVLAISLLKEKMWAFLPSIAVLLAFITYQSYQIGHTHSIALSILTALDIIVLSLVIWDYRRLKRYTKVSG